MDGILNTCKITSQHFLLDLTNMKYVYETAMNISKCLLLISELMAGEWQQAAWRGSPVDRPPWASRP